MFDPHIKRKTSTRLLSCAIEIPPTITNTLTIEIPPTVGGNLFALIHHCFKSQTAKSPTLMNRASQCLSTNRPLTMSYAHIKRKTPTRLLSCAIEIPPTITTTLTIEISPTVGGNLFALIHHVSNPRQQKARYTVTGFSVPKQK
jgi:hypothetical protein